MRRRVGPVAPRVGAGLADLEFLCKQEAQDGFNLLEREATFWGERNIVPDVPGSAQSARPRPLRVERNVKVKRKLIQILRLISDASGRGRLD